VRIRSASAPIGSYRLPILWQICHIAERSGSPYTAQLILSQAETTTGRHTAAHLACAKGRVQRLLEGAIREQTIALLHAEIPMAQYEQLRQVVEDWSRPCTSRSEIHRRVQRLREASNEDCRGIDEAAGVRQN
jgi:hypothetical protein